MLDLNLVRERDRAFRYLDLIRNEGWAGQCRVARFGDEEVVVFGIIAPGKDGWTPVFAVIDPPLEERLKDIRTTRLAVEKG